MGSNLSVSQMIAQLETKIALHREKQSFHAEREALHREQTALHTSEIEAAFAHLEAFRAAAVAIGEILERDKSSAPPPAEPELPADHGRKRTLSRMIARVLEGRAPDEVFGARSVTREIQERWGAKLRRRPDPRSVAATLRRWALAGRIHQVREGRAYYESLYRKVA
jgi:hypothetical protein